MIMEEKAKLVEALETIQDVCRKNPCSLCPLSDDEMYCIFRKSPVNWKVNESISKWRAVFWSES